MHAIASTTAMLIPGSPRVLVKATGHLMQIEHPREAAGLIANFVRKDRSAASDPNCAIHESRVSLVTVVTKRRPNRRTQR